MFKTALKIILSAGLLYWLIASGKLDFSLIKAALERGPQWLFAVLLIALQVQFGACRYKKLLETKSTKKLPYLDILKLNYIGVFFSSVLPGAVTGDLIKVVYVKKLDENLSRTYLVTLTLLDRILGLIGLLTLAGVFSLIYYRTLSGLSSKLAHLIHLNLFLFFGSLIFLGILLSPEPWQKPISFLVKKVPVIGKKISPIFELREKRADIFLCLFLSILSQFAGIFAFWIVSSPFYSTALPLQHVFTLIPVGFIATAIPISPGGMGVGHVLFENLFRLVQINNGASLFNLYFLCNLFHNLFGAIPYLTVGNLFWHKKKKSR